jgi:hypothetical protein
LSAISGQFSKSLILGTFMPVVFFIILNVFFLLPYLPADPPVFQQITDVDTRAILVITFVAVVLTGLLYNLNIPIVRFFEGYTWARTWIGSWRTARYQKELDSLLALRPRLRDLEDAIARRNKRQAQQTNGRTNELNSLRRAVGLTINREFPVRSSVLPTKLGNVIRSFENYPQRQYRMAAITLYPRLISIVDKDYLAQIDNAKSSFDFMINCSVLSAALALSVLVAGLLYPIPFSAPRLGIYWLIKIAFFFFLSWGFYLSSIGRASEWGDLVKGAFDLYRWKLLEQLGFKNAPENMEAERDLWQTISAQIIYGDRSNARLWDYVSPTPLAQGAPRSVKFETARGVKTDTKDTLSVSVWIKNRDAQERTVKKVRLTDTVPQGTSYVWSSAKFAHKPVSKRASEFSAWQPAIVTGSNPYQFSVGDLDYGDEVLLRYQILVPKD